MTLEEAGDSKPRGPPGGRSWADGMGCAGGGGGGGAGAAVVGTDPAAPAAAEPEGAARKSLVLYALSGNGMPCIVSVAVSETCDIS